MLQRKSGETLFDSQAQENYDLLIQTLKTAGFPFKICDERFVVEQYNGHPLIDQHYLTDEPL